MRPAKAAGAVLIVLAFSPAPSPALAQPAPASDTCVDVRIGDSRAYDCLNRQFERAIPRRRFSAAADAPAAAAPATTVGTFNEAATQQRLGTALGHSVEPQRSPPVAYSAPLVRR